MLYQLKHLNTGNFLKYPGLFPHCKNIQVISPPCLLLFAFLTISVLVGNFCKQQAKVGKEVEIESFCVASLVGGFTVAETRAIR